MTSNYTFSQVLVLLVITIAGVMWSVIFHQPLAAGFFPGYVLLILLGLRKNIPFKQLLRISISGIQKTRIVIIILFLVSFLLPSWYLSGTIDQMVKVALSFINPHYFFVLSFLAAMIFSMLLGTTIGTLSSIGIPILGTAVVLQLPVEIVAGALVSGAFVGDRTSPFSSSHQLLSHTVELPVNQQRKAMLLTTLVAITFCFGFYAILDFYHSSHTLVNQKHFEWSELSLIKFIPAFMLIGLVVCRLSIIYAFFSSILSAAFIAYINGTALTKIAAAFWYGIQGLGGGFSHMYELLLFLALAGAYNGLLEQLNVVQPYLDAWLESSRSLVSDTLRTVAATLLISVIAANQTLPIILTGRSFLPHWSTKYGKGELARVMGDTTMLFPGMVPWSVLAIMCSTIVGLPLISYLPYALFLWGLPFITISLSLIKQICKKKEKCAAAA